MATTLGSPPGPASAARDPDVDLRITGADPESWDPARSSDVETAATLAQVFESLTTFDEQGRVQPALAETWRIDDDGRRIVFELRDGLRFADGSRLDAEDVVASWLRVLDPERPSPLWSLLADVRGAREYVRGEGGKEAVGITAGDGEVIVEFRRPAAYFVAAAGSPTLAVVPDDVGDRVSGSGLPAAEVSSGAYVPVVRAPGSIRLRANEHYWAGPPALGTIDLVTDVGDVTAVEAFEAGDIDYTAVSRSDAAWLRYDRALGPSLRRTDSFSVEFYGFDTRRPPFDEPLVRRAFAQAIDWDRLLLLAAPEATPVTSIVPAGITGAGAEDFTPAYDPDAARDALAEAGYPGGRGFPEVAITTGGFEFDVAIARDLERELGISVAIEHVVDGYLERLERDPPQLWALAWIADYPHPQAFLGLLLETGSGSNYGRWSDAEYDAALERAAATSDPAEQERAFADAQRILRHEVPVIPVGYSEGWALSREGLLGGIESGMGIVRYAGMAWADR
jgi:oligopeptide transport system substrate-binding protein